MAGINTELARHIIAQQLLLNEDGTDVHFHIVTELIGAETDTPVPHIFFLSRFIMIVFFVRVLRRWTIYIYIYTMSVAFT